MQLRAGLGVGVVAQHLERVFEVGDGQRQLQVAAPTQAGPAVELGACFERLRVRERRLVVAGGFTPLAARERVVARGAHALHRLGIVDRVTGDEMVRDRARLEQDRRHLAVEVAPGRRRRAVVDGVRVHRVAEREVGVVLDQDAGVDRFGDRGVVRAADREDAPAFARRDRGRRR